MLNDYLDQSDESSSQPLSDREKVRLIVAERVKVTKPKTKKTRKRDLKPPERWPALNPKQIAAQIADVGFMYDKGARVVTRCEGLSGLATAIYLYLDSLCAPTAYKITIGHDDLAKRFGTVRQTIGEHIEELRYAGFLGHTPRGFKKSHEYTLPPRRKRLEWEAEQRTYTRKTGVSEVV